MAVEQGKMLSLEKHPNRTQYPDQELIVVEVNNYAYIVPCIQETDTTFFLKTIIPSRKATQKYLGGDNNE